VIAQTGYQFGASSVSGQVQFAIPNQGGDTVHICGRSANVYDVESAYELAPVTRWQIGGAGSNLRDADPPPAPVFGLTILPEGGGLQVCGLGFHTLENTGTISLGTITLYYFDESSVDPPPVLATGITVDDCNLTLSSQPDFSLPQYLAIGQEIVRLTALTEDGSAFVVERAVHGSKAVVHDTQAVAYPLKQLTVTFPFLESFFGTPASGNWTQAIVMANARVCTAELFMTNSQGNGPVTSNVYTSLVGGGLRTLTGGQVMLQVPGPLAVQNGAVPPLDPGAVYAVRDVYAYVGSAPSGGNGILLQVTMDGQPYCSLAIAGDKMRSPSTNGSILPVLRANKQIGLDILAVGSLSPGSNLTVVIRV
jgi:hypothetical protein